VYLFIFCQNSHFFIALTLLILFFSIFFTEIALLTPKQRQATVRAQGSLIVLALERATFTRVFGNLDEIMKRNMEEYNKYAASGI
jgi:preprotein translocase subunit SecY